jgi:mono/diheme cytochrome c family protein
VSARIVSIRLTQFARLAQRTRLARLARTKSHTASFIAACAAAFCACCLAATCAAFSAAFAPGLASARPIQPPAAARLVRSAGSVRQSAEPSSSNLADGKKIYDAQCGICHQPGGPRAIMLARRLGKDRSVLATRTDLSADYIRKIARVGIGSMPPFSRIAVPDSSLDLIVAYLTRPAADRAPSPDSRAPSQPAAAPGDGHAKPTGAAHE